MTDTPIPQHILRWRSAMNAAAHAEDLTVTFPGPPEEMAFTLTNPDGRRHINMRIYNNTVHLLPSPLIDLSIDRMVRIGKTFADAHESWLAEESNP